jgi:aspartyl-tRNA(Asn)/glutamyl-tRNA(Gln) amidotransferase subunit A
MAMNEPCDLDVVTAAAHIRHGDLSARELVASTLRRLEATEPVVHAYATVASESAIFQAREADEAQMRRRELGPLHGIPVAIKDLINTAGIPTEAGSRTLRGNVPSTDAKAVELLKAAGAIVIGKAVTHEFAYGLNLPPTRNAWDPTRYPGGSSAGSGVSVAVGSALASLGTDTGGSGRVPAAVNGLVALKPTYGLVSRAGVISMSATLDTIVPMTKAAADCAVIFDALVHPGQLAPPIGMLEAAADAGPSASVRSGPRIGIDHATHFATGIDADVRRCVEDALKVFRDMGACQIDLDLPEAELAVPITVLIVMVETSNYHRRLLRTSANEYDPKTRVMLEAGELLPGSAYLEAQRQRTLLIQRTRRTFAQHDLSIIAAPTHPVPAVPMEYLTNPLTSELAEGFSRALVHTGLANLTGLPAITIPCGFTRDGLPVGIQLMGRPHSERLLLDLAADYQGRTDWHTRRPAWLQTTN